MGATHAYAKRKDGQGWDVLVFLGGSVEVVGPYRLQREARHDLLTGKVDCIVAARNAATQQGGEG